MIRFILTAAGIAFAAPALASPVHAIDVASPRDYGIVIGATVVGAIRVAVESGYELETTTLPQPGSAVSDFLEVREVRWTKQAAGGETIYQISLTYQAFKGVRDAETLAVPALPLRFSRDGQATEAQAPSFPFTLTPLIPAALADEAVTLRGDLPLPDESAADHWRWLAAYLAGLAGVGVYVAWSSGLPPFRHRASPFARAAAGLRRLGKQPDLEAWRHGVRLVHAALNETAGGVVFSAQLAGFLAQRPQFAGLRAELEQFFALSERLFFADRPPDDYPWGRLEGLCRQLARAGRGRPVGAGFSPRNRGLKAAPTDSN